MNGKDAIKTALRSTHGILTMYLADLSDADLLVRPVPGANHIAWQLGHLVWAEQHLLEGHLPKGIHPPLPADFRARHDKENASSNDPAAFLKKSEYLGLFNQTREGTITAVDRLSEADLDRPTSGSMAKFAPTLGALLLLVSNHTLMHAGQVTPVRRKLGKPVLF